MIKSSVATVGAGMGDRVLMIMLQHPSFSIDDD